MSDDFSLYDAEQFFKACGCNHYYMLRTETDEYAHYKNLKISKVQEFQWIQESFAETLEQLADDATPRAKLWSMHTRATALAEAIQSIDALRSLADVSTQILEEVPEGDCTMCAESLLDRRDVSLRGGVIFLAMSLDEPALAVRFLEVAGQFINRYDQYAEREVKRSENVKMRAEAIRAMLNE